MCQSRRSLAKCSTHKQYRYIVVEHTGDVVPVYDLNSSGCKRNNCNVVYYILQVAPMRDLTYGASKQCSFKTLEGR